MLKQQATATEADADTDFVVVEGMNDAGMMELRAADSDRTVEVVDYVDELLEARLAELPAGNPVRLELLKTDRGDHVAVRLLPGGSPRLGL